MHVVVELPQFVADVRSARLIESERSAIIDRIAANPEAGDLIQGTGGARKVRFAGRGKGKSGGYRVITFYAGARASRSFCWPYTPRASAPTLPRLSAMTCDRFSDRS